MKRPRRHKIPQEELSNILVIGKAVARLGKDPEKYINTQNWCERRQKSFWIGYQIKRKSMGYDS